MKPRAEKGALGDMSTCVQDKEFSNYLITSRQLADRLRNVKVAGEAVCLDPTRRGEGRERERGRREGQGQIVKRGVAAKLERELLLYPNPSHVQREACS